MVRWARVSRSGFYAWLRRKPSLRNHNLPVAENLLNRDFTAEPLGEKMVIDITYISTDEGWLYLAGVMDVLQDAIKHTDDNIEGCILHLDSGSQYCSNAYQEMIE